MPEKQTVKRGGDGLMKCVMMLNWCVMEGMWNQDSSTVGMVWLYNMIIPATEQESFQTLHQKSLVHCLESS